MLSFRAKCPAKSQLRTIFSLILLLHLSQTIRKAKGVSCLSDTFAVRRTVALRLSLRRGQQIIISPTTDIVEDTSRRDLFRSISRSFSSVVASVLIGMDSSPTVAMAASVSDDVTTLSTIVMKTFIDPQGLFAINIPQRFFAIRRTNQGDLPNTATGSGRRGSSIFNAGDLAKAEVLAVERYVDCTLWETI
jgi:hypothetical protein